MTQSQPAVAAIHCYLTNRMTYGRKENRSNIHFVVVSLAAPHRNEQTSSYTNTPVPDPLNGEQGTKERNVPKIQKISTKPLIANGEFQWKRNAC